MKKILTLGMLLASIGFTNLSAEAKTNSANNANNSAVNNSEPQIRVQIGRNRRTRPRVYVTTRLVRRGLATFRETYRVTQYWNGRVDRRLISRIRVR